MDTEGLTRRRLLGLAGGVGALGAATAVDNVLLGYELLGTNLRKQDLSALFAGSLVDRVHHVERNGVVVLRFDDTLRLSDADTGEVLDERRWSALDDRDRRDIDDRHGLDGLVTGLGTLLASVDAGEVTFTFLDHGSFFERALGADHHETAVELLRGFPAAEPATVEDFVGADPRDPSEVVTGLVEAFRKQTHYDLARYGAGAVQFNLAGDAADLRAPFREDTSFGALADGGVGMFCEEFARRSVEALHAPSVAEQSPPVFGGLVVDDRHKHVYTTVGTVLRGPEGPEVVATFVDYTHTTLYDDLGLVGVLGEGLDAYNRRHRADWLWWWAAE
jgi:hypothetical protein